MHPSFTEFQGHLNEDLVTGCVDVLLRYKANHRAPGHNNQTPLELAITNKLYSCIHLLLKAGADMVSRYALKNVKFYVKIMPFKPLSSYPVPAVPTVSAAIILQIYLFSVGIKFSPFLLSVQLRFNTISALPPSYLTSY